jgi:hypothetical protein
MEFQGGSTLSRKSPTHVTELVEADDFDEDNNTLIPPFDSVKQYQPIHHDSLSLPTL